MDLAYDHIAEQSFSDRTPTPKPGDVSSTPTQADTTTTTTSTEPSRPTLQTELQDTFRAFSASPWASRLGGLWGNVRKQGESYYQEARKEAEAASEEALKGFTELKDSIVKRTRGLSLGEQDHVAAPDTSESVTASSEEVTNDPEYTNTTTDTQTLDTIETYLTRFRTEASKRLKDVERAEDAADEALLRLGTNIRNFLRDAVAVSPPDEALASENRGNVSDILFESKESSGRRAIHTNRLDAQLHMIHTRSQSFTEDPGMEGDSWKTWSDKYKSEDRTDDIAADLDKYPELRRRMEELVPEKVDYQIFWARYYFMRDGLEQAERRRKEVIKATQSNTSTEEVGWDEEESDGETQTQQLHKKQPLTPQLQPEPTTSSTPKPIIMVDSSKTSADPSRLQPTDSNGRRSHDEKSVADSDASYDLVSGATSRAPGSPGEGCGEGDSFARTVASREESDEEDWE